MEVTLRSNVAAVLPRYRQRLKEIEEIIGREKILSLPQRDARIRFASSAESARIPAPSMQPPRLIGNTGQYGEFLIPLRNPGAESDDKMDDFLHEAITWSLTAHEARPGHELQFSAMIENGVSLPRAVFANNSADVEGWGLYSEAIMMGFTARGSDSVAALSDSVAKPELPSGFTVPHVRSFRNAILEAIDRKTLHPKIFNLETHAMAWGVTPIPFRPMVLSSNGDVYAVDLPELDYLPFFSKFRLAVSYNESLVVNWKPSMLTAHPND